MAAAELKLLEPTDSPLEDSARALVPVSAVEFSEAVRAVSTLARGEGLSVPVYRSPPRVAGLDRTIRRRGRASAVVSIRLGGRPLAAVRSDVIDAVVAANDLDPAPADRFRRAAWDALESALPRGRRPTHAA